MADRSKTWRQYAWAEKGDRFNYWQRDGGGFSISEREPGRYTLVRIGRIRTARGIRRDPEVGVYGSLEEAMEAAADG